MPKKFSKRAVSKRSPGACNRGGMTALLLVFFYSYILYTFIDLNASVHILANKSVMRNFHSM